MPSRVVCKMRRAQGCMWGLHRVPQPNAQPCVQTSPARRRVAPASSSTCTTSSSCTTGSCWCALLLCTCYLPSAVTATRSNAWLQLFRGRGHGQLPSSAAVLCSPPNNLSPHGKTFDPGSLGAVQRLHVGKSPVRGPAAWDSATMLTGAVRAVRDGLLQQPLPVPQGPQGGL